MFLGDDGFAQRAIQVCNMVSSVDTQVSRMCTITQMSIYISPILTTARWTTVRKHSMLRVFIHLLKNERASDSG